MPLYAGMTVNERLVISGQMAAWDQAVAKRERARMIEILMATELTAEQAAHTADATLGKPAEKRRHSFVMAGLVQHKAGHDEIIKRAAKRQAVSACSRSAIRSSLSSMPIDSRTTSGAAPDFTLASSSSWLWVVEAG